MGGLGSRLGNASQAKVSGSKKKKKRYTHASICTHADTAKSHDKAGVNLKAVFFAGYYGLNANISFMFQAIKNFSTHLTYLCFRLVCKFFGDFLLHLGIKSFSQRISEIYGNRIFGRCCFEIRIGSLNLVDVHQTLKN